MDLSSTPLALALRHWTAALASELHHRASNLSYLVALAELSSNMTSIHTTDDLASDFDGGLAYLDLDGRPITSTQSSRLWDLVASGDVSLASSSDSEPVFSSPILDPVSNKHFVIVSQFVSSLKMIVAGAFSPESLARSTLSTSYPGSAHVTIFLLDRSRQILFSSGPLAKESIPSDHPGVTEALHAKSGTTYTDQDNVEHVVAYSSVELTGWALITEEEWKMVSSPSLQLTQMAPLVIAPAFILALLALWFVEAEQPNGVRSEWPLRSARPPRTRRLDRGNA